MDPAVGVAVLAVGVDALDAGAGVAVADVDGLAVDADVPAADEAACGGAGFEVEDATGEC